ncbi:GPW/gp25 family protein [Actinomycetospora cinnamomea]|uniref:IraD/Gp25-like domain-containing protein n=1 Tax=Actinomycetospora cinnamomea TaxID=663609 RepID=A0A2U1F7N9_9PSEU|nr:GPW/gp25 family protein [Actinomycetospora cinnamomea]PVZ08203.1 hypothetical protein C8D89_10986 [Actinomycetospora cinnamomea]
MTAVEIDFPFHVDATGRAATTTRDDHVADLVHQLLFTEPGERVNRPTFGGGLRKLVFEGNSPELAAALQFTLQAALAQWLGDVVDVEDLGVASQDVTLQVVVRYRVRRTGEVRTLELP